MPLQQLEIYEFGPFELDRPERTLRRGPEAVTLTPKVFDLLLLLVENQGKLLEKDVLLKKLWPDTFVEEANLSVNISTLRRALGQTPADTGFIETVPKRGYRFVAPVTKRSAAALSEIESPEIAPPMIVDVHARDQDSHEAITQARRRWLKPLLLTAALVVSAIAFFAIRAYVSRTPSDRKLKSLAILPFRSLTAQTAEERLGAGMANALIQRITNSHEITVRPPSAVLTYEHFQGDPVIAGKQLQVDAVLDGTIQREGDKIRVTVQLCRVRDHASLWAEQFDDMFGNIFAVQDSISEMVAKKLSLKLTELEMRRMNKRNTQSMEAYSLYLQGQYYANLRTKQDSMTAIEYFRRAIEKDPAFVMAHSELASAYINLAGTGQYNRYWDDAWQAAQKAVALDNSMSQAHLSLGRVYMRRDWNWDAAEREFRTALELDANFAAAHAAWSTLLTALGHSREAIQEMQRACDLDPQSGNHRSDLAWTYYCARKNAEAIENSKTALLLNTRSDVAHRQLEKEYLHAGRYQDAIEQYQLARDVNSQQASGSIADLALIYAISGKRAEAEEIYTSLRQLPSPETISNYSYATAALAGSLGHIDEGIDYLKKAQQQRLARAIWMAVDPDADFLRRDVRVKQLLKESRLIH